MLLSDTQAKGGVAPPVAGSKVGLDLALALSILAVPSSTRVRISKPEQEPNSEERRA